MSFTVTDEIIDYNKIGKEQGLDVNFRINVETHRVSVMINGEIPSTLTNLIRYFATYAYPTRRMIPNIVEVVNPDNKPLIEPVITQLMEMKFAHNCPLNEGQFSITHVWPFSEPVIVTARQLKEAEYVNDHQIVTLAKGCSFVFDYKIVEQTGIEADSTHHYFANLFERLSPEFKQVQRKTKFNDEVPYDTGIFRFRYTDNMSGHDVFKKITELAKKTLDDILENFAKYFSVNLAVPYLIVPNDRSGIIATCIARYVFEEYPKRFAVNPHQLKNHYICEYSGCTPDEIRDHIISAIKKIKKDLTY